MERQIVHFDLDAFFVSVEQLRHTELKGKPLIVGGDSQRGVVASASYEARKFGVHSAMSMKLAKRLCPQAIVIQGDYESYARYSSLVTEIIAEKVPLYEKSSIDEFYADLTGMDRFWGCMQYAAELKRYIQKESGLVISYTLASNKLMGKVGVNEVKPNGQLEIPFGTEQAFLAPLPIRKMPGIGQKTELLLRDMGVETIKVLSEIPSKLLQNLLGQPGMDLWKKARGIDDSPVVPYKEQKGISKETTFAEDLMEGRLLKAELVGLVEQVCFELRRQGRLSGCLTVKIRYADFNTVTKQCCLAYNNQDRVFIEKADELFRQLYQRRLRIRLIGVRLSRLISGAYQLSLFDDSQKSLQLDRAIDGIKNRFGVKMVTRAVCLPTNRA